MAKKSKDDGKETKSHTIDDLQKKLSRLRRKLKAARAELENAPAAPAAAAAPVKTAPSVSPLAPKDGFPDLPVISGVDFAAAKAGVKYAGRLDVMLARIAPGSSIAGVFTRSSTRAAPVLDCQQKLAALAGQTDAAGYAILVNSGNSNAFTGGVGVQAVEQTTNAGRPGA